MLNLDTHIVLFSLDGRLNAAERERIAADVCGISAIVLWELAKLHQLRRIHLAIDDPELSEALQPLHVWPIDLDVCRAMRRLDVRADPVDEIIASTSIAHGVPLLTRDSRIRSSRIVPFP